MTNKDQTYSLERWQLGTGSNSKTTASGIDELLKVLQPTQAEPAKALVTEAFCPMWAYTRCNFKIPTDQEDAKQQWKDHMRPHFRRNDEDIHDEIMCFFKSCVYAKKGDGYKVSKDEAENPIDLLMDNLDRFLDHVWEHFLGDRGLSVKDLSSDDSDTVFTAWDNEEIWPAYHEAEDRIQKGKQDVRLPDKLFTKFGRMIRESNYNPDERGLVQFSDGYITPEEEKGAWNYHSGQDDEDDEDDDVDDDYDEEHDDGDEKDKQARND